MTYLQIIILVAGMFSSELHGSVIRHKPRLELRRFTVREDHFIRLLSNLYNYP